MNWSEPVETVWVSASPRGVCFRGIVFTLVSYCLPILFTTSRNTLSLWEGKVVNFIFHNAFFFYEKIASVIMTQTSQEFSLILTCQNITVLAAWESVSIILSLFPSQIILFINHLCKFINGLIMLKIYYFMKFIY